MDEWESDGPVEQAVAMLGEAGVGGPMPSSWVSRLASGAVFECAALSTEMLVDVRAHGPDSTWALPTLITQILTTRCVLPLRLGEARCMPKPCMEEASSM